MYYIILGISKICKENINIVWIKILNFYQRSNLIYLIFVHNIPINLVSFIDYYNFISLGWIIKIILKFYSFFFFKKFVKYLKKKLFKIKIVFLNQSQLFISFLSNNW